MILSMRMHNIALIEDLTMEFGRGLHVMTGETGAGKSIVVDAVNLVLGGRADRDLIRTGTDKAWVEAVFDLEGGAEAAELLRAQEIECEGGVCTLYREISRSGRNLCRVCGLVMPVSFLRDLAARLMDVHGQHEHQFLLDPLRHMRFLDESGDEKHQTLLTETAQACAAFLDVHRRYARLVKENQRKQDRLEVLRRDLAEMDKAKLRPGEEETLRQEQDRYRHAEKIAQAVQTAYGCISAGEDGEPALVRLKTAMQALSGLSGLGDQYRSLAARCESAYYELEEIGYELGDMAEGGEFDPRRAEQVEARLDLIRRMERKYGDTVEKVLEHQEQLREEQDEWASLDQQLAKLGAEHKRLLAAYRTAARELAASRRELAKTFEKRMMAQLADLGMEKTVFAVSFAPPSRAGGCFRGKRATIRWNS